MTTRATLLTCALVGYALSSALVVITRAGASDGTPQPLGAADADWRSRGRMGVARFSLRAVGIARWSVLRRGDGGARRRDGARRVRSDVRRSGEHEAPARLFPARVPAPAAVQPADGFVGVRESARAPHARSAGSDRRGRARRAARRWGMEHGVAG